MGKKKLLTIIDSLSWGGAEMLVVKLLQELKDYELHLIVLNTPDALLHEVPADCKVTFYKFKSYWDIPRYSFTIRRYIRKNGIEIVHSHLYWSNIIARLAVPRGIKIFNTIHNISSIASYNVNRGSFYLEKLTYRKRHFIIAVSNTVLTDFDQWIRLKGPSIVLYNIIEDVFFTAPPKKYSSLPAVRLVAVGNLRKQKNYPFMLEVFKNMPAHFSLDIFGSGMLKDQMQEEIDKYGLNVRLRGSQPNMHLELRKYDAFVMCSTHEGLSLALLEAMASGLPVFLSDIPVQREAAGSVAVFFDLSKPLDAGNKIVEVCKDLKMLENMSVGSIERAKQIAQKERYMEQLLNLYESK